MAKDNKNENSTVSSEKPDIPVYTVPGGNSGGGFITWQLKSGILTHLMAAENSKQDKANQLVSHIYLHRTCMHNTNRSANPTAKSNKTRLMTKI